MLTGSTVPTVCQGRDQEAQQKTGAHGGFAASPELRVPSLVLGQCNGRRCESFEQSEGGKTRCLLLVRPGLPVLPSRKPDSSEENRDRRQSRSHLVFNVRDAGPTTSRVTDYRFDDPSDCYTTSLIASRSASESTAVSPNCDCNSLQRMPFSMSLLQRLPVFSTTSLIDWLISSNDNTCVKATETWASAL